MMVYNPSKKSSERETQEGKQIEYQRLKKKMKKKKKKEIILLRTTLLNTSTQA